MPVPAAAAMSVCACRTFHREHLKSIRLIYSLGERYREQSLPPAQDTE